MEKTKLIRVRDNKGLTQDEMAVMLNMDQTTYSRKEKGKLKINTREWKKIAQILDVPLAEIFEQEENSVVINNDNSPNSKVMTYSSDYCNVPEYVLESLRNYIKKLEDENAFLIQENKKLKM
jgi:DNA-binding XRE family transcriptional regulator